MNSRYAWAYLVAVALLCLVQIGLGANLLLLLVLAFISATAVLPLFFRSLLPSDILYMALGVYNGTAALAIKCAAGQPVQSNLLAPTESGAILLLGFISLSGGYMLSRAFYAPSRYFWGVQTAAADERTQSLLGKSLFLVGAGASLLQSVFRANIINGRFEDEGFGGFGALYPLLLLGVVLQVGLCIRNPQSKANQLILIGMGIVVLFLALANNVKKTAIDFIFILALSAAAYRIRVKPGIIIFGAAALFIMFAYIAPAIQIVRADPSVTGLNRIPATAEVIRDADFSPSTIGDEADKILSGYATAYRQSYVYPEPWNVERFTLLLQVDQVVRNLPTAGTMGMPTFFRDILETLLPGFLIEKSSIAPGDRIAWHFGFRDNGAIARPVVGLIASAVAAYGVLGAMLLPGITVAIAFAIFNRVGGALRNNPWSIFIVAGTIELVEKDIGSFAMYFSRSFLVIIALGIACRMISTFVPRSARQSLSPSKLR